MIRTVARVLGIAVLTVGVLSPAGAAPNKSSGAGSKPCNDGTVTWSPTTLWPPNHKMQTIQIGVMVGMISDNQAASDGSNELHGSGQPTDKQGLDWSGSGNMGSASDPGTATTTAQVRSERSGTDKGGRIYTIQVTCSDMGMGEMNMQTVNLTVTVPHDQGHS